MSISKVRERAKQDTNVAIHRSLRRSDAKTLTEDTSIVGGTRAVPKETAVAGNVGVLALAESLKLSLTLDAEDVLNFVLKVVS